MNDKLIIPLDGSEKNLVVRSEAEHERDRVIIARMYLRGKSIHEILFEVNALYTARPITIKEIEFELESIRTAWMRSTLFDFNTAKMKELARLDEVEREAWEAWERSKLKHVRLEYMVTDDQVPFSPERIAKVQRKKKYKVIEATVGDIKYLEVIERMIKMRCEIIGLFQAKQLQIDWRTEAIQSGMDEKTLDAVKEKTIETLVKAIEEAALESGKIKPEDIIDAEYGER